MLAGCEAAADIGAAPGGWSQWLVSEGGLKLCLAIDPGELHPTVLAMSTAAPEGRARGVVHLKETVEVAIETGHVAKRAPAEGFGLLVCDINAHPASVVKLVAALTPWLAADAKLLLTLKFVERGGKAGRALEEEARGLLADAAWIVHEAEQLISNGRWERTIVARRG